MCDGANDLTHKGKAALRHWSPFVVSERQMREPSELFACYIRYRSFVIRGSHSISRLLRDALACASAQQCLPELDGMSSDTWQARLRCMF